MACGPALRNAFSFGPLASPSSDALIASHVISWSRLCGGPAGQSRPPTLSAPSVVNHRSDGLGSVPCLEPTDSGVVDIVGQRDLAQRLDSGTRFRASRA